MRKGFTLLELLTVVIIVAILAAIAVPQFFKVAERARCAEGVNLLGAVRSSALRYYAENGELTADETLLDLDVPSQKFFDPFASFAVDYDPAGVNGVMASVKRNAVSNPGFDDYTLSIACDGTITCAGGTRCPSGF